MKEGLFIVCKERSMKALVKLDVGEGKEAIKVVLEPGE